MLTSCHAPVEEGLAFELGDAAFGRSGVLWGVVGGRGLN
jgi:hypothetical protein